MAKEKKARYSDQELENFRKLNKNLEIWVLLSNYRIEYKMSVKINRIPRVPKEEDERKYINHLQAKNHPIITRYITYDKLTDEDNILCVDPATNEYVIYQAKSEKADGYKRMKMLVEYLYEEKKYLIYMFK